jgi:HSP20 family molecular chaperone IbpA
MKKNDIFQDGTTFDPQIIMTDTGRYINVNIDLYGVQEEKIRIDLEKTTFTVSISENEKTLRKVIKIPAGVRIFKKKFSDGVLTLILEKPVS